MKTADIAIIGGGPGGYVAALRAARLGARVVLIEKDALGGTCLHRGCIPSKALLEVARTVRNLGRAGEMGIRLAGWTVDLEQVRRWRDRPVRLLARGVERLLEAAGVEVVRGRGVVAGPGAVDVLDAETGAPADRVEARRLFIAAGSVPAPLPLPGGGYWDSDRALELPEIPRRLAVIGGGPIGVEMASVYAALGAEIYVIEMAPRLLPREDGELGEALARALQRQAIRVHTGTRVTGLDALEGGGFRLRLEGANPGGPTTAPAASGPGAAGNPAVPPAELEVDRVLAAVGRRPADKGLGLENLGLPAGWVQVDDAQQTAAPGVFAFGDITGRHLLAHAASAQGVVAAERALGHAPTVDLSVVPACTFTWPEVASVGLSEEAARAAGHDLLVGRFPFSASGKAAAMGERDGFVKVVADKGSRRLLGAHVIGPDASTLIHEAALGIAARATIADVERAIHAHPTLSEAFAEACLAAEGRALHLP